MRYVGKAAVLAVISVVLSAAPGSAKPLIDSSEESYGSVCINYDDTPERLVEICTLALERPGSSRAQQAEMRDSLGYAYYDLDKLDEAQAVFEDMRARDGEDARAYLGLGWVAHDRSDHAAARGYFRQALDRKITAQGTAGLADSLWALREIEVAEAVLRFRAALAIQPDYFWARRRIGWVYLDVGDYEAAGDHFAAMLEARPHDTNARGGLMRAFFEMNRLEAALVQANRGLDEVPDNYWFLSQRSLILYHLERYNQAIRDAERLVEMDPSYSEGYVRRARAMVALGQRDAALSYLASAEAQTGHSNFMTYWRASMLLDDNRLQEAWAQIRRNIDTEDGDVFDYQLLARIELAREDYDAARAAIDRAKALDAADSYTLYYDAVVALRRATGVADALSRFDAAIASGLPKDMIADFAGELYRAGYIGHAIAIRAKYPD